ncbi:type I glyceraldehyde-3-phosphate dehydrogenase [Desulfogranum marinum]|jgi:erythrose-4-phosphate dehydrogenase|uniref:type I glyceraldehyde-3-phosphate dehydrogenase n=1 Tax=Desulfogranum marinum TaxID=453220 RepID=UPI001964F0F7|nr:glyceraldehyde 3-phosphate dehydrogenase NAD-binding domain-containing protein [Desulfogranum marinum]MBM9511809.1 erythrose-4-phosphate dehydrogenase [Desulfogranum marinum]
MSIRIAINGYGRIGRCILRALYESGKREKLQIVAINELASLASITHLTQFDSTHGKFGGTVSCDGTNLVVNKDVIKITCEKDISRLPWKDCEVDVVLECSGWYSDRTAAEQHLQSGAGKVLFSCPAQSDVDATIVYGLNHELLTAESRIVSNASCTTNCISHVIHLLDQLCSIESGVITTTHSMMNDQPVIDAYHNPDLRKSRSSGNSIIPVDTGLAKGIDRLFPHLQNRFKAVSLRVPTMNVSLMQLTAAVREQASVEAINAVFKQAADGELNQVLGYTDLPLVSCDFNHDPHSAVLDSNQTSTSGDTLVNLMAWFDNEWGYANRMLDTVLVMMHCK